MAKRKNDKKDLKFPVFSVKAGKKSKKFAVVYPKIEIPRINGMIPDHGIFTAEQVASSPRIAAYLVKIGSGALMEIADESEIQVDPDQEKNESE